MNLTAIPEQHAMTGIEMLSRLLVHINSAAIGLENKMVSQNVAAQVSGIGTGFDRLA